MNQCLLNRSYKFKGVDAMGVLTGKIVEIYLEDGKTMGKVRVGAATTNVGLILLMEAKVHDRVLIDSGIALAKVKEKKAVVE